MSTWSHITPVGHGGLLFYNDTTGRYAAATLAGTGALTTVFQGHEADLAGRTHIVASQLAME